MRPTSRAIPLRLLRPLRAPQPNATSGAQQRSTVDEGCDSTAKIVGVTCKPAPKINQGVQLLTTMLDVGNLNSDSQPVQKRFLGGPRKEKLRSFPHVEHSLIILSAGPGDVQYFGGPPGWIGHD